MRRPVVYPSLQAIRFVSVTLATVFMLSLLWECRLEQWTMIVLHIPYTAEFESVERWRFILTSTGFAALALILPGIRIGRLLAAQHSTFVSLNAERDRSEILARHDSLTGLYNRRVFIQALTQQLESPESKASVLVIDLDKFKPINDDHGHSIGDEVLCEIAARLAKFATSQAATVGRRGGDEFAIFVSDGNKENLSSMSKSLLQVISAPLASVRGNVSVGATIGVATSPDDAVASDALLICADHAMYRAKKFGKGTFQFYDSRYDWEQKAAVEFEEDLASAVVHEEIEPYFQPIVSFPDQRIVGFEILARWFHPKLGLQMPDTFIPVVEKLGLINHMSFSLLKTAINYAYKWPGDMTLALNVTAAMLEDSMLPERLYAILEQTKFPSHRLEIEVTEQALVRNLPAARRALQALRERGISVSLDDFGTGYSGIYHLTQLAIDKIKIDRSFMNNPDLGREKVIAAVLALSKGLKLTTTAEGIETQELAQMLIAGGCDFGQGYLFGKPMSAGDLDREFAQSGFNRFHVRENFVFSQARVPYGEKDMSRDEVGGKRP